MAAEGTFPNLDAVSCSQLTFGADIRLLPYQVGAIRDSILAMFPGASAPPWYFREVYRRDDADYEIAASISASNRSNPLKSYSAFFRIQKPGEQAIEGPLIRDLLQMLEPQDESIMYCTASFVRRVDEGEPHAALPPELYHDNQGRLALESYSMSIYDKLDVKVGNAELRRIGDDLNFYSISFSQSGKFSADFSSALLDQAVSLFRRVHRESEGETHAGKSA